jgi:hypothetical protein
MKKILSISLLVSLIAFLPYSIASAQKFLHPGIDQTAEEPNHGKMHLNG